MLLSVVIPTYKRNDLLAKCLAQLAPQQQSLSKIHYEVIISDDSPSNDAKSLINEEFPWALWVEGPKKGPAANRNNGARYAQGEWLAFTDDDCIPSSEWLKALYDAAFQANGNTILEGKTTCAEGVNGPLMHSPVNLNGGFLWSCNMAIPATLFAQMHGFDELFPFPHLEDVDFKERALQRGITLTFVNQAVVDHPPRKYHTFKKLALTHESDVYYYAKKGMRLSHGSLIRMVLQVRIRAVWRNLFHKDVMTYALSAFYEIIYISFRLRKWSKKYEHLLVK